MTDTASAESTAALPSFPMERKCPYSPPPAYAEMRAHNPVTKVKLALSGREVWVVTRQEDVRRVLTSSEMSSSVKLPGYPLQFPVPDEVLQTMELPLVAMDPPDHTVRRRAIIPELTVKRMQALRPRIQEIVDEHIDAMLAQGGPVDLVEALAIPVPSLLFCELMGVPHQDTTTFRAFAEKTVKSDVSPEEVAAATAEMDAYLDKLVAEKTENGSDDLLGRIIERNREERTLEHGDIVALGRMLLFGGFDTITNMIALGTATLLGHPEQLAEVKADPSLTAGAIEELLRYLSIADSATGRVALEDIEIGGVLIRAGEGIIALNGSANRDNTVFEDPDTFDIHREIKLHSAFGHGNHQCPGASLVRVELEIVFNTLFARIPGLRLAVPEDELKFKSHTLIHGMHSLPVTW
ncbi:cytochrome P450 [Streptomyces sp. NPDC004647]|uniref:cytochrome P450 n=1 Tax=Streptomyces sp. NPDC004647 TaxID=3154671 RepID=UPI0033AAB866